MFHIASDREYVLDTCNTDVITDVPALSYRSMPLHCE